MTSGEFTSFPLDQIFVDRPNRQRKELSSIDELAESISRTGLIHPIVIERSGELRVGERRYTACTQLGWTHIPVQFLDELDPAALQLLELEENIRRVDLDWKDQCDAIDRYHTLRKEEDPAWTLEQTGAALGISVQMASDKVQVAAALKSGHERVVNADKYSVAKNVVHREAERRRATVLEDLEPSPVDTREAPLLNVDFIEWQASYSGPKFNFIHCDFPYGIGADKHDGTAHDKLGGYDDSLETYDELLWILKLAMENVVADSAHMMFWFSMDHIDRTKEYLLNMGWTVNPFPLIWYKSDNTGVLPDPSRGPRRIYETAFLCSRGDRKIVQAVGNAFPAPTTKNIHMSEKSKLMLAHFFRMLVDEYTIMLDPTCGSANALRVAEDMGAKKVLGLEKSEEFYTLAKEHYYAGEDQGC